MSDKINKSTLKEAKEQFEEIKNFALEEAKKSLEDDVSKKVIELMESSLEDDDASVNEGENSGEDKKVVQEEVTVKADGTEIKVDDDGNVEINSGGEIEMDGEVLNGDEDEMLGEPADISDIESIETPEEDNEEIMVSDEDDEIEIDNSEIEEMENIEETNFEEQEAAAPAPAPAPEAAPAPAEEVPMEEPMEEPAAEEDAVANPFQQLMDKMDQMMSMMGGNAEAEAGGEEIDIVDDTEAAPAPAPAPEAGQEAPVAEEITFEVVNDMDVPEMEDEVLEIVGETEDDMEDMDDMDENTMSGQGHAVRRSAGNQDDAHGKTRPEVAAKRKRMNESAKDAKDTKDKAQYEAKIAELIKENESLKSEKEELEAELTKFENGFVKLQENFGKMQDYNAKLVMAYKVAMSGGLTTDEKVQISEQFDKCETVKDAENLYKSIVNEHKIKVNKNPEKSIKSTSIKSKPAKSVSQPLYESKEVARMKQLAGIKNKNE